jgi:hypothetical protein
MPCEDKSGRAIAYNGDLSDIVIKYFKEISREVVIPNGRNDYPEDHSAASEDGYQGSLS